MSLEDDLLAKIKILNDSIWDRKGSEPQIKAWLDNFSQPANGTEANRARHALYLLSQFMYFGTRQKHELMRVLFRDLYKYPIIERIRKDNNDTTDLSFIRQEFEHALDRTLFLGVGNPSESGCHLLYYFRQENGIPKTRFIHTHEVFKRQQPSKWAVFLSLFNWRDRYAGTLSLRNPDINRYVFIDDFCGSGHQAQSYSKSVVDDLKSFNAAIEVSYFVLCGTSEGIKAVRDNTSFDHVKCVFELDDSFKCFSQTSRYFPSPWANDVTPAFAEGMCQTYGDRLFPGDALGYNDCQLLLGFQHNTPDNTLPIFWSDGNGTTRWTPIFKRYPKLYG